MKCLHLTAVVMTLGMNTIAGAYDTQRTWSFNRPKLNGPIRLPAMDQYSSHAVVSGRGSNSTADEATVVDTTEATSDHPISSVEGCCATHPHFALNLWKGFCCTHKPWWFPKRYDCTEDGCEQACCPHAPLSFRPALREGIFGKGCHVPCGEACEPCGRSCDPCKAGGLIQHTLFGWVHELDWLRETRGLLHRDACANCGHRGACITCSSPLSWFKMRCGHTCATTGEPTPAEAPDVPPAPETNSPPVPPADAPETGAEKSALRGLVPSPFHLFPVAASE